MSKFAGLIAEARKPDQAVKPENQKARKPVTQKAAKPEAKETKVTVKKTEEAVNLTVKIAKSRRMHWAAEAKRAGVTLTEVICDALSKRFGEP